MPSLAVELRILRVRTVVSAQRLSSHTFMLHIIAIQLYGMVF
jgi:hypothetical protein